MVFCSLQDTVVLLPVTEVRVCYLNAVGTDRLPDTEIMIIIIIIIIIIVIIIFICFYKVPNPGL
jgi:hypothetical protein